MKKFTVLCTSLIQVIIIFVLLAISCHSEVWWDHSFSNRLQINITGVGNLSDYAAYMNVSKLSGMKGDFSDLRFLNGSCISIGNVLDYEIESYDSLHADIWLKIPVLDGCNQVCLYYGNPDALSVVDAGAVWDDDYVLVQHMEETDLDGDSGDIEDSTSHANDGTTYYMDNADLVSGVVDGTFNFSENNETIRIEDSSSLQFGSGDNITLEAWVNPDSFPDYATILSKTNPLDSEQRNYLMYLWSGTGELKVIYRDSTDSSWHRYASSSWQAPIGQFSYVAFTYRFAEGSSAKLYADGVTIAGSWDLGNGNAVPWTDADPLFIGQKGDDGFAYDGLIDEVRISNKSRSDDYFNQTYQLIADQASFVIFDDPVKLPVVSLISPSDDSRVKNPVVFRYNVTDDTFLYNCSLYVDSVFVEKTDDPENGSTLNFTRSISSDGIDWQINCTDSDGLMGASDVYHLTMDKVPSISSISLDSPISLEAAGNRTVYCNGTFEDLDGGDDIVKVNATLYNYELGILSISPDNKSTHYTDASCVLSGLDGDLIDFNCSFSLAYYALNGSWRCNVTALDSIGESNSSVADSVVEQLIAIGTSESFVDFGNVPKMEVSSAVLLNITNYGNVPLDLTVYSYADEDSDGLAMSCDSGEIGLSYERFALVSDLEYSSMSQVTAKASPSPIDVSIPPATEGMLSSEETYWKLMVPSSVEGRCEGRLVFTALLDV